MIRNERIIAKFYLFNTATPKVIVKINADIDGNRSRLTQKPNVCHNDWIKVRSPRHNRMFRYLPAQRRKMGRA